MTHPRVWICRAAVCSAFLSCAAAAYGATWAGGRTTPTVREIVAIDATGETNWPYGAEDVAGDGLETFRQQEQSIDIRTAYAATDPQRFWARVYMSDSQPAGGNVHAFVFIDSDRNLGTGGTAVAPEINSNFTNDPSPGGYEHVVEVTGSGSSVQLWNWQGNRYVNGNLPPGRVTGEASTDTDPIRIGAQTHGYVQLAIELSAVDLTQACDANLYFRTANDTPSLGAGDLEVGQVGACIPADANNNGVPDIIVPPGGCASNAECPAGGICQAGQCILARACTTNGDCGAGMQCTTDGRCVPVPSGTCTTNAQCNGLVCQGGQCVACTSGGNQCGTGSVCGPDGHCVVDQGPGGGTGAGGTLTLAADESVKGGACHCALSVRTRTGGGQALCVAALALFVARRRSARRR